MSDSTDRLARLIEIRNNTGLSLDYIADMTEGLPYSSVAILCGNSAVLPKNKYSNVKP
jgi:hypothetical protein